jgi:hypothetical protein
MRRKERLSCKISTDKRKVIGAIQIIRHTLGPEGRGAVGCHQMPQGGGGKTPFSDSLAEQILSELGVSVYEQFGYQDQVYS